MDVINIFMRHDFLQFCQRLKNTHTDAHWRLSIDLLPTTKIPICSSARSGGFGRPATESVGAIFKWSPVIDSKCRVICMIHIVFVGVLNSVLIELA